MDDDNSMHRLLRELYPLCRSITGEGVRRTLKRIGEEIPVQWTELESGTRVLDWVIPDEWRIREAWVEAPNGKRIIDFQEHSLHLVSYSEPVDGMFSLEELQPHLHSLPERPDWIPYRTSYYQRDWGFCLPHRLRETLGAGRYRVRIDSEISPGHLTYGEVILPGETTEEILLSAHICHPSLANDNLSGIAIAVELSKWLAKRKDRRFSYRILFAPGTIGAIAWLSNNRSVLPRVRGGLVLNGLGGPHPWTYKQSRRGGARIDKVSERVLRELGLSHRIEGFSPYGYDERQFCSPGFDLPVGSLSRGGWGSYPEYHTSADNPEFVTAKSLGESADLVRRILEEMERERRTEDGLYVGTVLCGEPQLGRRGLYGAAGDLDTMAALWVLNYSDGEHTLREIADRSGLALSRLVQAARRLMERDLLTRP